MPETLHVRCADDARVTFRTPDGTLVLGRFYGRDRDGAALPDGEIVRVGAGNWAELHQAIYSHHHLALVAAEG